jgi:hypothetical protein
VISVKVDRKNIFELANYLGALESPNPLVRVIKKMTREDLHVINIMPLHKKKLLYPGSHIHLTSINTSYEVDMFVGYSHMDIKVRNVHQHIPMEFTSRGKKGSVWYWLCPQCGKRAATLFEYSEQWVCWKCTGLRNDLQMTPTNKVTAFNLNRIAQVKEQTGTLSKPRFMRDKTFLRLLATREKAYTLEELAPVIPLVLKYHSEKVAKDSRS